ncbi:PCYCGC domain-containing protein [Desertibacillus haloalkaliphilus]|nr:PCYCGC domain-containing protein [Desertibacillus haloalkaliphilus]
MRDEGKPLTEVRDYIDEKYSHFADPTPTPYPPEGV